MVAAVVVIGAVAVAFFAARSVSGTELVNLPLGACFDLDADAAVVVRVTEVSCTTPHTHEAFAVYRYPAAGNAAYPGDDEVESSALAGCVPQFRGFVGESYASSALEIVAFHPTASSWTDDRTVVCAITSAEPRSSSARAATT